MAKSAKRWRDYTNDAWLVLFDLEQRIQAGDLEEMSTLGEDKEQLQVLKAAREILAQYEEVER